MKIGINARFLRKPGTGIGQVTREFLWALSKLSEIQAHEVILYVENPIDAELGLPREWKTHVVQSWYSRDDLIREHLFEMRELPKAVMQDGCHAFFSLYQSATILPENVHHAMLVHDLVPVHFPEYLGNFRQRFHYRSVLRAIRKASLLFSPSEATARDLEKELEIKRDTLHVMPLGLSSNFQQAPEATKVEEILKSFNLEPGYIYHGGGLEVRKNTTSLLEAYAALKRKRPNIPPLVISGKIHAKTNPLATDVLEAVHALQIEASVKLLGFVEEQALPSLYRGALFFVYPSLSEGFGLPVLEALAMGTPVLTTNTTSLPEVAGGVARYCDPHAASIEQGMEELLNNSGLRRELSEAGPLQAKKFSWEKFSRTALALLIQ